MLCAARGARLYVPQVGIINPSEMQPSNSIEDGDSGWPSAGRGTLAGRAHRRVAHQRREELAHGGLPVGRGCMRWAGCSSSSRCSCRAVCGRVGRAAAKAPQEERKPAAGAGAGRGQGREHGPRSHRPAPPEDLRAAVVRTSPRKLLGRPPHSCCGPRNLTVSFDGFQGHRRRHAAARQGRAPLHHRAERARARRRSWTSSRGKDAAPELGAPWFPRSRAKERAHAPDRVPHRRAGHRPQVPAAHRLPRGTPSTRTARLALRGKQGRLSQPVRAARQGAEGPHRGRPSRRSVSPICATGQAGLLAHGQKAVARDRDVALSAAEGAAGRRAPSRA